MQEKCGSYLEAESLRCALEKFSPQSGTGLIRSVVFLRLCGTVMFMLFLCLVTSRLLAPCSRVHLRDTEKGND